MTLVVRARRVVIHWATDSVKRLKTLETECGGGKFAQEGEYHRGVSLHGLFVCGGEPAWDLAEGEVWVGLGQGQGHCLS